MLESECACAYVCVSGCVCLCAQGVCKLVCLCVCVQGVCMCCAGCFLVCVCWEGTWVCVDTVCVHGFVVLVSVYLWGCLSVHVWVGGCTWHLMCVFNTEMTVHALSHENATDLSCGFFLLLFLPNRSAHKAVWASFEVSNFTQ